MLYYIKLDMYLYVYNNIWVVAVLKLDIHPDHNKGLDRAACACPMTQSIVHRS